MVTPTNEQISVIKSPTEGITKVIAYAGTGKTTMLVGFAQERPRHRGLYVAFNKSTQLDASRRFPPNVLCKTIHSMAFAKIGRQYSHKLGANLRPSDVIQWLSLGYDYDFAHLVIETVQAYMSSAQLEFPDHACSPSRAVEVPRIRGDFAAAMAKRLWEMMCDPTSPVPMLHDGYLKLFQLSQPKLPFDYIMLDEYQDTNPVTASIVLNQTCPRVLVGDPYQGIYQFRGARDALEGIRADRTYYLTHSFRFGPRIAALASRMLLEYFGETHPLVGLGPNTVFGTHDPKRPFATLCRTNAEVFNRSVGAVYCGASIGFVGGIGSYGFDRFVDAYRLSIGQVGDIRDPFIRSFSSYADYETYQIASGDREAKMVQNIVTTYGSMIPDLIKKIKDHSLPNLEACQRIFSTAHKAKGMEFPTVVLTDDFCDLIGPDGPINEGEDFNPEEIRLTYVALTRAQQVLELNSQLRTFAKWSGIPCQNETLLTEPEAQQEDNIDFDDEDSATRATPSNVECRDDADWMKVLTTTAACIVASPAPQTKPETGGRTPHRFENLSLF